MTVRDRAQAAVTPLWPFALLMAGLVGIIVIQTLRQQVTTVSDPVALFNGVCGCGQCPLVSYGAVGVVVIGIAGLLAIKLAGRRRS